MSTKVNLKLVNADRYSCPLVNDGNVVEKGQIVSVDEAAADVLLADKKYDALNNEHDIWVTVSDEEAAAPVMEDDDEEDAPKARPNRVARSKK